MIRVSMCAFCREEFIFDDRKAQEGKYCSRNCYFLSHTKPLIIKTCIKCSKKFAIYESNPSASKFCSYKCYYSYPKSQEFRDKISKLFKGALHPNWKGGVTKGRKERNHATYQNWRKGVFSRDKYTCQKCGIRNCAGLGKSVKFNAHHIKSWLNFPELRYEVANGITLCESCHDKTRHTKKAITSKEEKCCSKEKETLSKQTK